MSFQTKTIYIYISICTCRRRDCFSLDVYVKTRQTNRWQHLLAISCRKQGTWLGAVGVHYICLVGCRLPPLDGYVYVCLVLTIRSLWFQLSHAVIFYFIRTRPTTTMTMTTTMTTTTTTTMTTTTTTMTTTTTTTTGERANGCKEQQLLK